VGNSNLIEGVAEWFAPREPSTDRIKREFRVGLTEDQKAIINSIERHRHTAVPSAHDVGKSFIAAVASCDWIESHEIGEAFVVTTAPTAAQVNAVLWREIEKLHRKAGLIGSINVGRIPEWKIGKELVAYGRKPSDYDETGFQGIHATYILIIIDEAAGIPDQLWTAIEALATNENARILAIGNPDDAQSEFKRICMPTSGWNVLHLDGLLSPNFNEREVKAASNLSTTGDLYQFMLDNKIPFSTERVTFEMSQALLSPLWVAERMKGWNVVKDSDGSWSTSMLWEARVRGRFPSSSTEGVIPYSWIEAAIARWEEWSAQGLPVEKVPGTRVYGVDVARFGTDETCTSERQGAVVLNIERVARQDTQTTALRVAARLKQHPGSRAVVDVIGVGGGVVDRLREKEMDVIAFNSAAKTDMMDHSGEFSFSNTRSAAWWNLRELLDPSNPATVLALPRDEYLIADLTAPTWRVASGAKITVEPKEDTKKRLKRSPDTADALLMSLWYEGIDGGGEAYLAEYGEKSDFTESFEDTSDEARAYIAGETDYGSSFSSFNLDEWANS
jgi:hypothetical protein